MKLALVFLSVFLFASCAQQLQTKRLPWPLVMPMSYYYSPRAFYQWQNPYFLDDAGLDSSDPSPSMDWEEPGQTFQPEEEATKNSQESTKPLESTQSRAANRLFRPNSFNLAQLHPSQQQQQRFFFGALNPFNSRPNNGWFGNFFPSSTLVTVTVPSTLLTAVISTCIPATHFAAAAAPPKAVSTTPCARRRRHIVDPLENGDESNSFFLQSQLSPTPIQHVEPTTISTAIFDRVRRQADDFQQQIISSKDDVYGNAQQQFFQRQNRALTVTFTTTTTSFVFSSTVVKKTLNLVGGAQISCLPIGFVVC